jgi:hypothetical protein
VRRGLAKVLAERISSTEYIQVIDGILRTHGIDVPPTQLTPRASQSIGIPVGPFAATPVPNGIGTPTSGLLAPSPGFLATPAPFPAIRASTAPSEPTADAVTAEVPKERARTRPFVIAVLVLAVISAATVALWSYRRNNAADDKAARLEAALRELEGGPTCADRKKAIATLVGLGDAKAVPAIKKARELGKANACLRNAANDAINKLAGRK